MWQEGEEGVSPSLPQMTYRLGRSRWCGDQDTQGLVSPREGSREMEGSEKGSNGGGTARSVCTALDERGATTLAAEGMESMVI